MLPVVQEISRSFQRNGGVFTIQVTQHGGEATQIARQLPATTDAVLIVGGDGTACETINGLIGRDIPIVILRTGTENLLARELQMPIDINAVVTTLFFGEPKPLDVGVVNGRHFIAVAGAGFDAECVVRMTKIRSGHITRGDYFWPIWRTFWAHQYPNLTVEADGEVVFEGRGLALVGVIGQYSGGLRILSDAQYDDGLLDLCIFPCCTRTGLVMHALRAYVNRHTQHAGTIYRQCKTFRISSREHVPLEIDGDVGGALPAEFAVLPDAIHFLQLTTRAQ